jgi:SnoaL-like domain
VDRTRFDEYIDRFNAEDHTAFDEFIHPELRMQNGGLVFHGVQGMKDHYARIWRTFREVLDVQRFVSDDDTIAIEMQTHFDALRADEDTPFGPVVRGDLFDYHGVIMYRMENGKFADIRVAYLSFAHTAPDGTTTQRGLAH